MNPDPTILDEADWTAREAAHQHRVDRFVAPHQERAQRGESHPVWDFLFTYYSLRPRQLRRWHPGFGFGLRGRAAERFLTRSGYRAAGPAVSVSAELLESRRDTVTFIADLLARTTDRPARFNCFGLHEWAMVYRSPEGDTVRSRCASGPPAPMPSSIRCRCGAATSMPSGSSPRRPPTSTPKNCVAIPS